MNLEYWVTDKSLTYTFFQQKWAQRKGGQPAGKMREKSQKLKDYQGFCE